ncbi:hypothetical protein SLS62_007542 [Diatrype stigma]|uniref:Uncharacterized protein n=1 Tax=Diatrype stigma TaxID=117547 RepID=A0AAN9UML8_9PEZI
MAGLPDTTYNIIKRSTYLAYTFVNYQSIDQVTCQWLFQNDLTFVHAIMSVISVFKDPRRGSWSPSTHFHLQRTIRHLNEELSRGTAVSLRRSSTIYIVGLLAVVAAILGNYAELGVHLSGLQQIVQLCGGRDFLHSMPGLHFELERSDPVRQGSLDLAFVLATEEAPHFLEIRTASPAGTGFWDPCFGDDDDDDDEAQDRQQPPGISNSQLAFAACLSDPRLVTVCHDVRRLVAMVDEQAPRRSRLLCSNVYSGVSSIERRLLRLEGCYGVVSGPPNTNANTTADECLRLGLLAFMSVFDFQIPCGSGEEEKKENKNQKNTEGANMTPTQKKAKQRAYLVSHLRDACQAIEFSETGISDTPHLDRLVFWVLTIGAMSIFDVSREPWLVEKWALVLDKMHPDPQKQEEKDPRILWEHARADLDGFFWLRCVHDEWGQKMFERLRGMARSSLG